MKRKCNYCRKLATHICDFYGDEVIEIAGCEEHKYSAIAKMHSERMQQNFRDRSINFSKELERMLGKTA